MRGSDRETKRDRETNSGRIRDGHRDPGRDRDRESVRRDPARKEMSEVAQPGPGTAVE